MASANQLNNFNYVGLIGMCVYTPFLAFCLFRTYLSCADEKWKFHYKPLFHVLLSGHILLDLIYLIDIYQTGTENTVAYGFHLIAVYLNLCAFSSVILFWSKTLPFGQAKYILSLRLVYVLLAFNAVVTFTFVLILGEKIDALSCFYDLCVTGLYTINCLFVKDTCSNILDVAYASDSISLLLLSVWLTGLGIVLQVRLTHVSPANYSAAERHRRIAVLLRINLVLAVCSVCFGVRVFFVAFLLYANVTGNVASLNSLGAVYDYTLYWFVCTKWIPYLVPSLMLLYLMRAKPAALSKPLAAQAQQEEGGPDGLLAKLEEGEFTGMESHDWMSEGAHYYKRSNNHTRSKTNNNNKDNNTHNPQHKVRKSKGRQSRTNNNNNNNNTNNNNNNEEDGQEYDDQDEDDDDDYSVKLSEESLSMSMRATNTSIDTLNTGPVYLAQLGQLEMTTTAGGANL